LTGKQITSAQAASYGLVHDVMPLGRLTSAARELARDLLARPAEALRETKRLLHQDEGAQSKIAHLADTASYIRCLQLSDAREGIAAFTEKRSPKFGG
jgi:enoyl-CoA hydratase/carnithine racemase